MAKGDDGFRQGRQGAFHREGGAVASAREELLRALLAIEDLGFTWNEGGPLESLERRRDMDFQGFSKIILVAVWRVDERKSWADRCGETGRRFHSSSAKR